MQYMQVHPFPKSCRLSFSEIIYPSGCSLIRRNTATADIAVMMPNIHSILSKPVPYVASSGFEPTSKGVTSIAIIIPIYWARAERPAARPLSSRGNHRTVRAVTALRIKGCAMASPIWEMTTPVKLAANIALHKAEIPAIAAPSPQCCFNTVGI